MKAIEVNFDGLVGPTHNYSGLSFGNIASLKHKNKPANPKKAALQGLDKMKFLNDLGIKQAVLPPHDRPYIPVLRELGFHGNDTQVIQKAFKEAPEIFAACCSSASMWTANAATISPSADSVNKKVNITPANLSSKFHRSIEPMTTSKVLKSIFNDPVFFQHHPPLHISGNHFGDEGAANHTRFCSGYGNRGIELFVFGHYAFRQSALTPEKFPARQSYEASQAIVRSHQLFPGTYVFAQQSPHAIDAGVFHNDVISVGNENFFFYHEESFVGQDNVIKEIGEKFYKENEKEMCFLEVPKKIIPLEIAVKTYLFNSQIVSIANGDMSLICPIECKEEPSVKQYLNQIIKEKGNPIIDIHYFDLRESMRNGGGPACLRLRVVLNENEIKVANSHVFFNDKLYKELREWVERNYRDEIIPKDLADPELLKESRIALDELSKLLNLGTIYPFQR